MEKITILLGKLASGMGRKDEVPNQALAQEILAASDHEAIAILIDHLTHKSKNIQNDCIKVLYEVGQGNPEMISPYTNDFLVLLEHKNNRLQWGAMTALNCIVKVRPVDIYDQLSNILTASDNGSVITKDQAINILIHLASVSKYSEDAFSLLIEQLMKSPTNQLPMYAEKTIPLITPQNKSIFINTLRSRLDDIEKESKRKRVEKVIKKLSWS